MELIIAFSINSTMTTALRFSFFLRNLCYEIFDDRLSRGIPYLLHKSNILAEGENLIIIVDDNDCERHQQHTEYLQRTR